MVAYVWGAPPPSPAPKKLARLRAALAGGRYVNDFQEEKRQALIERILLLRKK